MLANDQLAWRLIIRRPAFTFVAVLILGLGIEQRDDLQLGRNDSAEAPARRSGQDRRNPRHHADAQQPELLASEFPGLPQCSSDGLEDVMAFRMAAMNLRADGSPVRVWGELVTPNFFDLLRVTPMLAADFSPSEGERAGSAPVAVISEALWRRVFAADASIVGRAVTLTTSFTIIGVTPPRFHGSTAGLALDVFVPMTMQKVIHVGGQTGLRGNAFMQVFAAPRQVRRSIAHRRQRQWLPRGSPSSIPTTTRVVGRSSCRCTVMAPATCSCPWSPRSWRSSASCS